MVHEGLVEVRPRQGYRVREITAVGVREAHELRLLLEPAAVELAIERATDAELEDLHDLAHASYDHGDRETYERFVLKNRQFHVGWRPWACCRKTPWWREGRVSFAGRDLGSVPDVDLRRIRGRECGVVFQDPMSSLNPVQRIRDQIAESLIVHMKQTRKQAYLRAVDLLEEVGIPDPARRAAAYPHQFSGGMRQRVMIAMALACRPRLLIADEPTTALDVTVQAQITDLVQRLQREHGMAVVWITHDPGVVAQMADQVSVMYAGRIVESGPCAELYSAPNHPYTVGLLTAVPRLDAALGRDLVEIPGTPPDPKHVPSGCSFAPRCFMAHEDCVTERPPLTTRAGRAAACWYVEEVPAPVEQAAAAAQVALGTGSHPPATASELLRVDGLKVHFGTHGRWLGKSAPHPSGRRGRPDVGRGRDAGPGGGERVGQVDAGPDGGRH